MSRFSSSSIRSTLVPLALFAGDAAAGFAGLTAAWWLRYQSPVRGLGIPVPAAGLHVYLLPLLVGVGLLLVTCAQFGLYDARILLRLHQSLHGLLKAAAAWLLAYLGIWLLLELNPPVSRLFAGLAFGCVTAAVAGWRTLAYALVSRTLLASRLRRRTALLGWNEDAATIAETISGDPMHPLVLAGIVALPADDLRSAPEGAVLGPVADLNRILAEGRIDLLVATRLDLPRQSLRAAVESCERAYVEWKVVPGAFDIFLSGLKLQTIGRVPVLGVEELPINRLLHRVLKRGIDLAGAALGLVLAAPVMAVLAVRIRKESPDGPVLFRQTRVGTGHRPFTLYKLRSMAPGAALTDDAQQSTPSGDPRLLRLGAFMRRWNLDELPQFWNVLAGDMSLVGPRPERPYHVERLADEIPHYLPRHLVKPGMTGWAQVNGLRGSGSLAARIRHDIFYIENWSVWFDLQILLLTLARWKGGPSGLPAAPLSGTADSAHSGRTSR